MTIKELCKKHINCSVCPYLPLCGDRPENYGLGEDLEVTNAIIETAKALGQHCEDAISRAETVRFLKNHSNDFKDVKIGMAFQAAASLVNNPFNLPCVQPKPKTGQWISYWDEDARCHVYKCPECGNKQPFDTKYCWECGTKLSENPTGSEGEDKE